MDNTTFEDIYNIFLSKISDNSLANLTQIELEEELFLLMQKSLAMFTNLKEYTMDDILEEFNRPLTNMEQLIIANGMVIEWISPRINNISMMKMRLGDRDYQAYSQANHLNSLQNIRKQAEADFHYWMGKYSLINFMKGQN